MTSKTLTLRLDKFHSEQLEILSNRFEEKTASKTIMTLIDMFESMENKALELESRYNDLHDAYLDKHTALENVRLACSKLLEIASQEDLFIKKIKDVTC
ncbi:MAG: hypothetical protein JKY01_09010 [Pseudomonadales bacterium]|nr:hypothetical protein [Pseudomonadales bacterium]